MGFLKFLESFDATCVLTTLAFVAVAGFVAILMGWIVLPRELKKSQADGEYWRGIAVPSLQMSGNLVSAVKNEA